MEPIPYPEDRQPRDPQAHLEQGEAPVVSPQPPNARFWRTLAAALVFHMGLVWALDALPPRTGEVLPLRWLRALAEHPIRGPLGLALAVLGVRLLLRALRQPDTQD